MPARNGFGAPPDVEDAARQRAAARAERDWARADLLRAQIEAAGWKVIDAGTAFRLEPLHPADVVADGRTRYGSSASVPSLLGEPASDLATVVLRATNWPDDLDRTLAALEATNPAQAGVIVVADAPSDAQEARLDAIESARSTVRQPQILWTSDRLGTAGALNAGIRRSLGSIVILLDTSVEATGDLVTPLVAALADPTVAVAGGFGLVTADVRQFADAPAGDVDAIGLYCLAFRRDDYRERGPLDEHFRYYRNLDVWWSLVLRDEGPEQPTRRAIALDLPLVRHEHREWEATREPERTRLSKRNFYRVLDRFRGRLDLASGGRA